jgi:hypothetical protein
MAAAELSGSRRGRKKNRVRHRVDRSAICGANVLRAGGCGRADMRDGASVDFSGCAGLRRVKWNNSNEAFPRFMALIATR